MSSQKTALYLTIVEVLSLIALSILSIFIGYPLAKLFPFLEDGFGLLPAISGIMVGTFLVGFIYTAVTKRPFLLLIVIGLISSLLLLLWSTELLISDLYTPFKEIRTIVIWHTIPLFLGLYSGFLVRTIFYNPLKPLKNQEF